MPSGSAHKLRRSFFNRPTLDVAEDLIGKYLVHAAPKGVRSARIVEVEAYIGEDDPASHAAPGPTRRNQIMYGQPGMAYIYFIYGMYHCLNFVTEKKGYPAAVLIRAAEPAEGFDATPRHRSALRDGRQLSGPGKLCRGFGLSLAQNGLDLMGPVLYLEDRGGRSPKIARSARIGIRKGLDRQWRFFDADSRAVSGSKSSVRARAICRVGRSVTEI